MGIKSQTLTDCIFEMCGASPHFNDIGFIFHLALYSVFGLAHSLSLTRSKGDTLSVREKEKCAHISLWCGCVALILRLHFRFGVVCVFFECVKDLMNVEEQPKISMWQKWTLLLSFRFDCWCLNLLKVFFLLFQLQVGVSRLTQFSSNKYCSLSSQMFGAR